MIIAVLLQILYICSNLTVEMENYILMADIVHSSKLNSKLLLHNFKENVILINKNFEKKLKTPLKISLGDEFQTVTKDLNGIFEIIFLVDNLLLESPVHYKLRYVIFLGEIDTDFGEDDLMLGKGLSDARKQLGENRRKIDRYFIHLGNSKPQIDQQNLLNQCLLIYQNYYDNWKQKDKKIVLELLKNEDYKKVAEIINLDKSSVWRRKKSLNIREFSAIKEIILKLSTHVN